MNKTVEQISLFSLLTEKWIVNIILKRVYLFKLSAVWVIFVMFLMALYSFKSFTALFPIHFNTVTLTFLEISLFVSCHSHNVFLHYFHNYFHFCYLIELRYIFIQWNAMVNDHNLQATFFMTINNLFSILIQTIN